MDPGVDLYHAQLLGGGTVGATWPWIQPHLGLLLSERLDSVIEKCPQEVQPLLAPPVAIAEGLRAWVATC
jgi:hypothetical protein